MVRAAACLCTEGGRCDHRGPWRKPREDAGHCLRLVKRQDASLILEGLRSSLSLSVLLENLRCPSCWWPGGSWSSSVWENWLRSSDLMPGHSWPGLHQELLPTPPPPPKSLVSQEPREQPQLCTDLKAVSIFFLAKSFRLSSKTFLSSLKASSMPFLEVLLFGRLHGRGGGAPEGCQGHLVEWSQRACVPSLSFHTCRWSYCCEDRVHGISAGFVGKPESPLKPAFVVLWLVWIQTLVETGKWVVRPSDEAHHAKTGSARGFKGA